jgi:hypothetical protein
VLARGAPARCPTRPVPEGLYPLPRVSGLLVKLLSGDQDSYNLILDSGSEGSSPSGPGINPD